MSYDLYCYRSTLGIPDAQEAQGVVESIKAAEEAGITSLSDSGAKERLAAALISHNPRLRRFAQQPLKHIELNPPEGDLAVQFLIYDDHVDITVPLLVRRQSSRSAFCSVVELFEGD